jgi:hypothetical protein
MACAGSNGGSPRGDCTYPSDTPGSNAYLVGGVVDRNGAPLAGVSVVATNQRSIVAPSADTTNQTGCYFLGLAPGDSYDVTLRKDGYQEERLTSVVVQSGEKRIRDVILAGG